MVTNYAAMHVDTQAEIMAQEATNRRALYARAGLWNRAQMEIARSHADFNAATGDIRSAWRDGAGDAFVTRSLATLNNLKQWDNLLSQNNPAADMRDLAVEINMVNTTVQANTKRWWEIATSTPGPMAALGLTAEQERLQRESGRLMAELDAHYGEVAKKVTAAGGGPPFQGLNSSGQGQQPAGSPGGQSASGGPSAQQSGGGQPGGGQPGGGQSGGGQSGGSQSGGGGAQPGGGQPGGGQPGGADPGAAGVPDVPDPSLSGGLGSAPVAPTPPSVTPTVPSTGLPGGGGGVPPMGGIGGGGISGGVGGAAPTAAKPPVGLRNPGVTPTGVAPTVTRLPGASSGAATGGGVPPMMGGMGGMGAAGLGGGGGAPGSGAAQRAMGRSKRRNDGSTPGIPTALGGRASRPAPDRPDQSRASDVPTNDPVIDEDLWQVADRRQALGH